MKKLHTIQTPSAMEDQWQREATRAAVEAVRKVVKDGTIPPGTPIGRLSDVELGWIIAAVLFAWIRIRAEQAVAAEINSEQLIRLTGYDPEPWDAGAVTAILPDLANLDIDWTKPLAVWSAETITQFLLRAMQLIRTAMLARDLGEGISRKSSPEILAREANAAAGGPLMTPDEFDDGIPF